MKNIAVFGASGTLGNAFCHLLATKHQAAHIHAVARVPVAFEQPNIQSHILNFDDELALQSLIDSLTQEQQLDCVIVAIGLLHHSDSNITPEKSLRALPAEQFHQLFHVNMVLPMLIAKHSLPKLSRHTPSRFAVLSARVGSISDNRLGGWYAYRSAKAALNMGIKNLSIELQRKNPTAIVVALHPGTVDSPLSQPFQNNVPEGKLFTPEFSASCLLAVLERLTSTDSGKIWAWDGQEILP